MIAMQQTSDAPPAARLPWTKIAVGVVAAALVLVLARMVGGYIPLFAAWVDGLGVWGPIVFILGYAAAVVAFVPGSVLTLAAGAIFGVVEGAAWVFVAAVLGSSAAFFVARYVARGAVERRLAGNARFAAIDRAVGEEGRKIVFLLRLSPAFPFSLLNYALGLTRVRFADYLIAALGMIPGTLLYVYYGSALGDVAALAAGTPARSDTAGSILFWVGLAATVLVTAVVTRTARRALKDVADP